jgi:hypothetical protein
VMDVLSVLLEREDGRAIMPHAHLIIQCFSKRFVGPDFDDSPGVSAQLKLSEMKITPTGSVKQGMKQQDNRGDGVMLCDVVCSILVALEKRDSHLRHASISRLHCLYHILILILITRHAPPCACMHCITTQILILSLHTSSLSPCAELKLLCRIAERVFSRSDIAIDSVSICNLATLLLGMLRTYTTSRKIRVEEEWVLDILRIYGSLLWRMEDVTPHIAFIGRLFGPAGTQSQTHTHSYLSSYSSYSYSYSYSYFIIYSYSILPFNSLLILLFFISAFLSSFSPSSPLVSLHYLCYTSILSL